MAEETDAPPPSRELKGLARAVFQYVEARSQLLQIEAREVGSKSAALAVGASIALAALLIAWLLAVPAVVWIVAEAVEWHWSRVALAAAGIHLLIALLFWALTRSRLKRLKPFEASLLELQKDREWIAPKNQP